MKKLVVLLAGLLSMICLSAASAEEVAEVQHRELLMGSDYTDVAITGSVVLIGLAVVVAHRRALDKADRIRGEESSADPAMGNPSARRRTQERNRGGTR